MINIKELDNNTWNYLTMRRKWGLIRFKIVTNKLFIYNIYIHILCECLNILGTYVTTNNSINNKPEFFFYSDLKIVYYNNY